jgi:tRNA uridine 5-carboxymethylaminomethyl modification enzyme
MRVSMPTIPAKAALLVAPEGQLVEQMSGDPLGRALEEAREKLKVLTLSPAAAVKAGWTVNQDGRMRSAWEYLSYKEITLAHLRAVWPELNSIAHEVGAQIEIEALYAAYLDRQSEDVAALRRDESLTLPDGLDYDAIGGLSNEVRSKLKAVRPLTLGQAARIEGVTPGALTALPGHVRRVRRTG